MSKVVLNPEVAGKYTCNLVNPNFDCLGRSYNLETISVAEVDELVKQGNTAFVLKKVVETPKETKPNKA